MKTTVLVYDDWLSTMLYDLDYQYLRLVEVETEEDLVGLNIILAPSLAEDHPLYVPLTRRIASRVGGWQRAREQHDA